MCAEKEENKAGKKKQQKLDEGEQRISVTWDGKEKELPKGLSLEDILGPEQGRSDNPIIVAKVNNRVVELSYIPENGDAIIPLDLRSSEGNRTYRRGLLHTFIRAALAVIPDCNVWVETSVDSGLYCEIDASEPLDPFLVDRIGRTMREYIEKDQPFVRRLINKEEAIDLYEANGQLDKARLLAFREDEVFKIYTAGGYSDYFYGHMPPSTGYLQKFRLIYEMPGLIMLYPQMEDLTAELTFHAPRKLMHVFRESNRWARILDCDTIADLNDLTFDEDKLAEFILINEARHDAETHDMAKLIEKSGARLVLVAGPSSSGKTTFTQKLRLQLRMQGKKPVMLSLDNYYIDRDQIPLEEDGTVDLENINTLDLPLFNEHLTKLLHGDKVEIPSFNFEIAKREPHSKRTLRLDKDDVLLVEGIHGLNESLTESIPGNEKFKIYISALTQLNLDRHNRISTTDVRLLRRLVRDYASRGSSAEDTLAMWPSVRAGENRWIFPYQERADVMFNSTLVYELLYLKKEALPLLTAIDEQSEYFSEANRLLKFLKYILPPQEGSEWLIPNTSLLREFIGGGVFDR